MSLANCYTDSDTKTYAASTAPPYSGTASIIKACFQQYAWYTVNKVF